MDSFVSVKCPKPSKPGSVTPPQRSRSGVQLLSERAVDGSAWVSPESFGRILRGGCWEKEARDCRSASRMWYNQGSKGFDIGFRVVREP